MVKEKDWIGVREALSEDRTFSEIVKTFKISPSTLSRIKQMDDLEFQAFRESGGKIPTSQSITDPDILEQKKRIEQLRLQNIENKLERESERLSGGGYNNSGSNNPELNLMQKEIEALKDQLRDSREAQKYQQVISELKEMKVQQQYSQKENGNGQQNYKALDLIGLIKLSQNTSDANNNKYNELFMKMIENKNGGNGLGDAIENYKSIESLGVMIGKKHDGGKDKTEIISDLISGIAGQLKDPITKMVDHVATNAPQPNQEQMQAMQAKIDRVRGKTPSPYNSVPPTNAPVYSNASEQPVSLKANANVEPPTTALPPLDSDGGFSSPPSTEQFLHGQAVFPDMISMYQDQDENGRGKTPVQDNDNYQARNAPEISLQEAEKRMQEKQQNYDNALRESREQLPAHEQQLNDAYAQEQVNGVDPSLITISDKEKKV